VHDGMPAHPETFVLYFLDATGTPQELLQYETLQIAVDQAYAIAGYPQQEWTTCDIPVLDDGGYDVAQLKKAVANEMPLLNKVNAVIELLQAAAAEPTKLPNAIRALQAMVWHTEGWAVGLSEASSEALRAWAYDLDYYEPDPDWRTEDPAYFAEDRALEEIRNALARVRLSNGVG
jgi:hypothetical protein